MNTIPEAEFDGTIGFLREGYRYVGNRSKRLRSDAFRTRIMLRRVLCLTGADAARFFYEGDRFTRQGAMPQTTLRLLQDKGSVQLLDGDAHRQRKAMFLSFLAGDGAVRLADHFEAEWDAILPAWRNAGPIVLFDALREVLCRAVCRWAGVPLSDRDAIDRSEEFGAMIEGSGTPGLRTIHGLLRRRRTEAWARRAIEDMRSAARQSDRPASTIAFYRENGALLDTDSATVELLNVLRPTVAINRFITFAALALYEHPGSHELVAGGDDRAIEWFAQEVRRFYPFFPVIGGRATAPTEWRGEKIAKRDWVLLDLYGTNHDPGLWPQPDRFDPRRFENWSGDPNTLVPQGAGVVERSHRCPGEAATIQVIGRAVRLLARLDYRVPPQDLHVPLSRMPTMPTSGFVIELL